MARNGRAKCLALGLPALAVVSIAALAGCEQANKFAAPPPPEVSVATPVRRAVTESIIYTGNTRPFETVDLRARVKGFLKEANFQPGAEVKRGDVLFVIDEEPFQVRVEAAKAKLEEALATLEKAKQSKKREISTAQLALDDASLSLAQVEDRRNRALLSRNAASRDDVDKSEAAMKKAAAQVEADKASLEQSKADFQTEILSAQAQVDSARADLRNAEIDLGYCRISTPIDGRITRKLVDAGNLVGDGQSDILATVVDEDPIYAYMSVSEADVLMFRSQVSKGERPDYRKDLVPVDLGLDNEKGFPHPGRVDYVDPAVDPATGTIQARAIFDNKDRKIIAGLFVRVRVPVTNNPNALLVVERSLGSDQQGKFVLVVGNGDKVERRSVTLGPREGDLRVITTGLKADDRVVVDGVQRARVDQVVKPVLAEMITAVPEDKSATKPDVAAKDEPKAAEPVTKVEAKPAGPAKAETPAPK